MLLFKTVILTSLEQVSTASTIFSLLWEHLSYSLLAGVVTSTAHIHFAHSFVSIRFSSSRSHHCWGLTAMITVLWCYCWYNHSGTIKITKDVVSVVFSSEHHIFPIFPLEEEGICLPPSNTAVLSALPLLLPFTLSHPTFSTSTLYDDVQIILWISFTGRFQRGLGIWRG